MDIDRLNDNINRREEIIKDLNEYVLQLSRFTPYIDEAEFKDVKERFNIIRKKVLEKLDEQIVGVKKDKLNVLRLTGSAPVSGIIETPEAIAVREEMERELELEEAIKMFKKSEGTSEEINARIKASQAIQNLQVAKQKVKIEKQKASTQVISTPSANVIKTSISSSTPSIVGTVQTVSKTNATVPVGNLPCPRIPGLKNFGNTCFANSVIWPFVALEWDSNFYGIDNKPGYKNGPFLNLMYAFKHGNYNDVIDRHYKFVVNQVRKDGQFRGNSQQDAHELITWIFSKPENNNWITRFGVKVLTERKCDNPVGISEKKSVNQEIQIPVSNFPDNTTLNTLLKSREQIEVIDDSNKFRDLNCVSGTETTQDKFISFKNVIMIQLKRFKTNTGGIFNDKINTLFDMPEVYNFGQHLTPAVPSIYTLVGFITHMGGTGGGHYVATIKINGEWIHYNDNSTPVKQINTKALKDAKDAYIFFYKSGGSVGSLAASGSPGASLISDPEGVIIPKPSICPNFYVIKGGKGILSGLDSKGDFKNIIIVDPSGTAFLNGSTVYSGGGLSGEIYNFFKTGGVKMEGQDHGLGNITYGQTMINEGPFTPTIKFMIHATGPDGNRSPNNKEGIFYKTLQTTVENIKTSLLTKFGELNKNTELRIPLISSFIYGGPVVKNNLKTYMTNYINYLQRELCNDLKNMKVVVALYTGEEQKEFDELYRGRMTSSPIRIRKKISPTSKILKDRKKKKQMISKLKKNK